MTRFFGANRSFADGFKVWKFAIFAAFNDHSILIVATFLGPEFPSMFGGMIGLAIVVTAKNGFLMDETDKWDFDAKENREDEWSGSMQASDSASTQEFNGSYPRMVSLFIRSWFVSSYKASCP